MKIIVTIIPANLVTNSLLSLFCLFVETKKQSNFHVFHQKIWMKSILIHKYNTSQHESTLVNMNQHESNMSKHESDMSQHKSGMS